MHDAASCRLWPVEPTHIICSFMPKIVKMLKKLGIEFPIKTGIQCPFLSYVSINGLRWFLLIKVDHIDRLYIWLDGPIWADGLTPPHPGQAEDVPLDHEHQRGCLYNAGDHRQASPPWARAGLDNPDRVLVGSTKSRSSKPVTRAPHQVLQQLTSAELFRVSQSFTDR